MPLAQTTVIRLSNFPPTLPNVPPNYPLKPAPGKIELLLNSNDNYLYHRFSPYTNYHDSLFASVLSNKQPFVYTFIDQKDDGIINQLPDTVKNLVNVVGVNQASVNDVVRVSKFLISSWGVQFLITQAAIQRLAPFDETRIYNPLSPILATVQPLTAGIGNMPTRHIEGGLLGLASSVTNIVGINLQSGFQTPSSTAGNVALPTSNTGQGKGLIRGGGAGKGFAQVQLKWPIAPSSPTSGGLSNGLKALGTAMGNAAGQMFGVTKVKQPAGTQVRADEATYGYMATSYKLNLKQGWYPSMNVTVSPGGGPISASPAYKLAGQVSAVVSSIASFVANPLGSSLGVLTNLLNPSSAGTTPLKRVKLITMPDGTALYKSTNAGLSGYPITGKVGGIVVTAKPTGYSIADGDKYGSNVGRPIFEDDLTNSDTLVQYSYYLQDSQNFPSKFGDANRADKLKNDLQKVLDKINKNFNGNTYLAYKSPASYLLPAAGFDADYVKYDNWTKKQQGAQVIGASGEYADNRNGRPKTIDAFVSKNNNLRMATSFMSDGMNTLGVLGRKREINSDNSSVSKDYTGWTEWKPYEDDLIAFFFYDVVNEKYIPFRATVKAISEGNTAFWDELRFIGRADQLYSYNGFSRTLSFTFNVVIGSVNELLPSWKKINYLASSVKPSNYTATDDTSNKRFNRFIVPPMFMLTIGDLYKFQPVVITSLNVNIPDDAAWETLNEDNSRLGWNYLNGLVVAPNLGKNYGQLPREVEIAVTCNLLEKERAVVGGSHFGHQPRVDDWESIKTSNPSIFLNSGSVDVPYLPVPTTLHQQFVEWNAPGTPARKKDADRDLLDAGTPFNATIAQNANLA